MFAELLIEDTDVPADFARHIEQDDSGDGDTVYLYIGLYAEAGGAA